MKASKKQKNKTKKKKKKKKKTFSEGTNTENWFEVG